MINALKHIINQSKLEIQELSISNTYILSDFVKQMLEYDDMRDRRTRKFGRDNPK